MRSGRCGRGWRILEAIAELNEADPELALQVRVGVNTGEAVVSLGARPEQGEGIVTGDVVNTAARIQGAAPVGGVAVGEQTYRATERVFEYEPLEPVAVKGKAEPLALWRAMAARARFGSDVTRRYTTPLVGRELERPLSDRDVRAGGAAAVGAAGHGRGRAGGGQEPAVSRSCSPTSRSEPELIRWRQGRCLPYGEGITFWALGEIVKAEAGILESDSPEVAAAKLERRSPAEEPERPWLRARLGAAGRGRGGVAGGAGGVCSPPGGASWRRWPRPGRAVLVFEDLHWADQALLAFLEHLADWAEGVPLLVLCTARPELYEQHPGWAAGSRNATTINLSPLSDQETAELVSHLIATSGAAARRLQQRVLERAGGNPLYAEEFVRLLADRGTGRRARWSCRRVVQALIAARLDTLSPERKSLLQDAAVLGKVFWAGALAEMGDRDRARGRAGVARARAQGARPPGPRQLDGGRERSTGSGTCSSATSPTARSRGRSGRAGTAPRPPGSSARPASGSRTWPRCSPTTTCRRSSSPRRPATRSRQTSSRTRAPLPRARRRARARPRHRPGRGAARPRARAHPRPTTRSGPSCSLRWAEAAFQAGRPREAAAALERGARLFRASDEQRGRSAGADPARPRHARSWARAAASRSPPRRSPCSSRSRPARRSSLPTRELAAAHFLAGAYGEAIAAAERALCARRDARPARAGARARPSAASLAPTSAIRTASPRWSGRSPCSSSRARATNAAILQNNLAIARYPLQGPARSLADFEQGIAFCEQRGLAEVAETIEADCPGLLVELGRPEEALERAGALAAAVEASGGTCALIWLRALELATHLARGEAEGASGIADWLVEAARTQADARRDRRGARGRRRRPARRRRTRPGARAPRRDRADARRT